LQGISVPQRWVVGYGLRAVVLTSLNGHSCERTVKLPYRVLADASKVTGLTGDNFEVWEISKAEFEQFRRQ